MSPLLLSQEASDPLKSAVWKTGDRTDRRDVPGLFPPDLGITKTNPKPSLSADRVISVIFFLWLDCRVSWSLTFPIMLRSGTPSSGHSECNGDYYVNRGQSWS